MKQTVTTNNTFVRIEQGSKLVEVDRHGYVLTDGSVPVDMVLQAIELAKKVLL